MEEMRQTSFSAHCSVTGKLVREKIGPTLKILVQLRTNSPWNFSPVNQFPWNLGLGDQFFLKNFGPPGPIFHGKLVRE